MQQSLAAGRPVTLDHVGIFADGVAVRRVGDETFRLCQRYVDEVITVDTDQTCAAIRDMFEETRSIAEPAGALAIAGIKSYIAREKARDATFVAVIGGTNVNFDRLRHIAERAAVGEQREMLLAVEIPYNEPHTKYMAVEANWRRITEEIWPFVQGPPSTPMGEDIAKWEAERRAQGHPTFGHLSQ